MKWREPWLASLKSQPPFQPLGPRVTRAFILWSLVFAVLISISVLARQDVALREVASRWWVVPIGAALMSFLLYTVWWLSPRKVQSGPRGIVVTKGDELVLIPWGAISSYEVTSSGKLRIAAGPGGEYSLTLPRDAPIREIEAEMLDMTRPAGRAQ